jgi:type IV secretory pathway ATPase VirB11/archaellum biosynthesis ATPase
MEERTTSVQHSVETKAPRWCAVASRQNVLICGDPVTGKEEAMAATIFDTDRVALIEEMSEILLEEPNYVRY